MRLEHSKVPVPEESSHSGGGWSHEHGHFQGTTVMSVKRGGSAGCPAGEGESVTAAEKVTAELVLEEGGASRWMDMGKMADESACKGVGRCTGYSGKNG